MEILMGSVIIILCIVLIVALQTIKEYKVRLRIETKDHIETKKNLLYYQSNEYQDFQKERLLGITNSFYFTDNKNQVVGNVIGKPRLNKQGFIMGYNFFVRRKSRITKAYSNVRVSIKLLKNKKLTIPKR